MTKTRAMSDGPLAKRDPALRGIVAAAVTPVAPDLTVDLPRLVRHVTWLLENGCDMVSLFGSSGEGPSFSVAARVEATAQVVRAGIPASRLIPAVIATAVQDTRDLLAGYAALDCRAVLVMPPFFFECGDDGVLAFFEQTVGALGQRIPFLLYHYPAMSGFGFGPDLIARLSERFGEQLVGIKDSSGDREHGRGLIARFPHLAVFTGTDTDLFPLLAEGGAGIIGGVPNANAPLLRARMTVRPDRAEALDRIIRDVFALVAAMGGPIPLRVMAAQVHHDPEWLRPMPPLIAAEASACAALISGIEAAGYSLSTFQSA